MSEEKPRLVSQLEMENLRLSTALDEAYRYEHSIRQWLLRIHGYKALLIGLLMWFTGTAQIFELQGGQWTRLPIGGLAFSGGAVLILGVELGELSKRFFLESAGVLLVGLWDFVMGAGFFWATLVYGHVQVQAPWNLHVIDPLQPRPYGIVLYLGLTTMLWGVHIRAVLRDKRRQERV